MDEDDQRVAAEAQLSYPHPIALAIRQFRYERDPWRRYEQLLEAAEKTTVLLGVVGLSWARSRWRLSLGHDWLESLQRGGVSLGTWLSTSTTIGEAMAQSGDQFSGYADALRPRRRNAGARGALQDIVTERNTKLLREIRKFTEELQRPRQRFGQG